MTHHVAPQERDWRSRRGDDWRDRDRDREREGGRDVRYRDGGRDRDYGGHRREHPRGGGLDPSVPTPVVVLRNLHPDTAQDKVCFFINLPHRHSLPFC